MPEKSKYYARFRDAKLSDGQTVEAHLEGVAERIDRFFVNRDKPIKELERLAKIARAAARWHDLGKFSQKFQRRINGSNEKVDHSTAGAQIANEKFSGSPQEMAIGRILEYVIACHHTGLINGDSGLAGDESCLKGRLGKDVEPYKENCPTEFFDKPDLSFADIAFIGEGAKDPKDIAFRMSFLIRMVFSALVDADRLDAEWFENPEKEQIRKDYPSLKELSEKLDAHLAELAKNAPDNDLNHRRAEVQQSCLNAAELDAGLFTLTVPTGGGKTLSSLAFALKHALKHGMYRVIYVIPYTSIIEQNAKVFREALGEDLQRAVVEHHSNFEEEDKSYGDDEPSPHDLACENWDAPIIVTTNVQFFESLFASKGSRCRKVHNIANSVVILDEAQMLPVNLLRPCIETIRELSARYHSTVVLCTATQPALNMRDDFKFGLEGAREIVGDKAAVEKLYNDLKRVEVEFIGKQTDDELVGLLKTHDQALCIVNTKGHARKLYEMLNETDIDKESLFHLSTNLCPAHRSKVFNELIRPRLEKKQPCIVISTQLVEAGVDIDFPTVYRATAGIDSIAQAAGRCNREGKLKIGKTYVFESEHKIPDVLIDIRKRAGVTEEVQRHHSNVLSLEAIKNFFELYIWGIGEQYLDSKKIIESLAKELQHIYFPFRDIAEAFRIIDSPTTAVFIEYNDEAKEIASKFRHFDKDTHYRKLYRKAQRYTVSLYQQDFAKIRPALEDTDRGVFILTSAGKYDERMGIVIGNPNEIDPSKLNR